MTHLQKISNEEDNDIEEETEEPLQWIIYIIIKVRLNINRMILVIKIFESKKSKYRYCCISLVIVFVSIIILRSNSKENMPCKPLVGIVIITRSRTESYMLCFLTREMLLIYDGSKVLLLF